MTKVKHGHDTCTSIAEHGKLLVSMQAQLKQLQDESEHGDRHIREIVNAKLEKTREDISNMRSSLQETDKKADRITDLAMSIKELVGRIEKLEDKVVGLLDSKKMGVSTIMSIVQSIITAAVLVWLGLK